MRRRPGVSAVSAADEYASKFRDLARQRAAFDAETTAERLHEFTAALERFAATHRDAIRADAAFRHEFHVMCDAIGVDPLASRRSSWALALGLGDFYAELSVGVAEACLSSRDRDGGVCALSEIVRRVNERRGSVAGAVSADDVERAIASLATLGGGWRTYAADDETRDGATTSGRRSDRDERDKIVRSVPMELSADASDALASARDDAEGRATASALAAARGWSRLRARDALESAVRLGIAWVDDQARDAGERAYWFPAFRRASSPPAPPAALRV